MLIQSSFEDVFKLPIIMDSTYFNIKFVTI